MTNFIGGGVKMNFIATSIEDGNSQKHPVSLVVVDEE